MLILYGKRRKKYWNYQFRFAYDLKTVKYRSLFLSLTTLSLLYQRSMTTRPNNFYYKRTVIWFRVLNEPMQQYAKGVETFKQNRFEPAIKLLNERTNEKNTHTDSNWIAELNRFALSRLKSAINSLLESQKNVALCLYVVCLISPMCDFFIPVQMTKKIVDASTIFTTKRNIRKNLYV